MRGVDGLIPSTAIVRALLTFSKELSKNLEGRPFLSRLPAPGSAVLLRGARLSRSAIARIAEAREADQHHRPGRGLGNRAADGEVEAKAARPVSDEIIGDGQVDAGPPKLEPRLMTLSRKKLSATARLLKVESRISTPLAIMVNSID